MLFYFKAVLTDSIVDGTWNVMRPIMGHLLSEVLNASAHLA